MQWLKEQEKVMPYVKGMGKFPYTKAGKSAAKKAAQKVKAKKKAGKKKSSKRGA